MPSIQVFSILCWSLSSPRAGEFAGHPACGDRMSDLCSHAPGQTPSSLKTPNVGSMIPAANKATRSAAPNSRAQGKGASNVTGKWQRCLMVVRAFTSPWLHPSHLVTWTVH